MKNQIKLSWFIISLGVSSAILIMFFLFYIIYHLVIDFYTEEFKDYIKLYAVQLNQSIEVLQDKSISNIKNYIENQNHLLKEKNIDLKYFENEDFLIKNINEIFIKENYDKNQPIYIKNNHFLYYIYPIKIKENQFLGFAVYRKNLESEYNQLQKQMINIFYPSFFLPVLGSIILTGILVYFLNKGIYKLNEFFKSIKTISDLTRFDEKKYNFLFFELNQIYEELKDILFKIQKIAVDREILKTEVNILEEFIITSEAIQDWMDYITKILVRVKNIIEFYFFYSIFKEKEDLIIVYIFHRFKEIKEQRSLEEKILMEFKNSVLYKDDLEIKFVYKKISEDFSKLENLNQVETIHKSILIEKPVIGGILGVGIDLSQKEDEIKKLAMESLIATMINFIGSIKAINLYTRELEYYATRDPLTNLYNQRVFWDLLNYEVERAIRHNYSFALLVIDLDNFKVLNDNYGHHFGDLFLKEFAKLLRNFFRKEDILARYGGDEFVVILPYVNNLHIEDILKRLVEKINHFYLPTQELGLAKISASIGVAVFPENAHSAKDLFLIADETMYLAKEDGKNCYKIYNKKSQEYFSNKDQHISKLILDVLEFKNIEPYVQPIVSIKDNTIFAYEVLMRIQDTGNNQIITANRFIPIAERMGVIQQLDLILLEKVLKYISNIKNTKFFLNLSPKTLTSNSDLEKIISLLNHYNYKNLVFEITERETIKDFDSLRNFIFKLKKFGIEFAIDDFGSGFSSYLYIKEIPIDYIKIEGNFIRTMLTNEIDKVFIDSIVKMARILNIKTIAEFVENKMIMEALSYSHIDFVQGNYIQSPFPLREIQK